MARMVDADALIEEMRKTEEECENAMTCPSWWSALSVIEKQPTAYNVEKVEKELDEYITKIVGRNSALYQTIMRIVREGGVE